MAAGFGQFGAVAALGDVARSFGRIAPGATITDRAGLSGTELGVGLALLHLASLGALPVTGSADRFGRRRVLLVACAAGLGLTVCAAASPGYWWFVAIFALGRPLLTGSATIAQVGAAEETASRERAAAIALIAAAYGIGAGLTAIVHALWSDTLGFRGVFVLAALPLATLPLVSRWVAEPDRFRRLTRAERHPRPVLGVVEPPFRRPLVVVSLLAFAVSVVTGPANSFLFLYAQNIVGLGGATVTGMVVASGASGLVGLLVGRSLADRIGRRPTAAGAIVGMVVCGWLAYSGSAPAVVVGYVLGILSASTFAPAAGALVTELFPTAVRASAAGWQIVAGVIGAVCGLVVFGAVADLGNRFGVAALVTFSPAIAAVALFALLPETRGLEPEQLWPDEPAARTGVARSSAAWTDAGRAAGR
jgi:MFS family permease